MQNAEITYTAEPNVDIETAKASKQFQDWLAIVNRERFVIRSIHFQSLDMFGKTKVGFIKFKADVVDSTGKTLSGIVFMRGGSVGILTIFICEGKLYAVMTRQPRFPTGSFEFMEVPAGMLDGSGNFAGVAAKELHEELGIVIAEADLFDLTAAAGNPGGIYLSPGGSEETIRLFLYEKEVTRAEMDAMQGRLGGCIEEGEQITLEIIPFDDLVKIPDAKTLAAYALYLEHRTAPKS
jgi:ADP-sugar diphosphatase